MDTISIESVTSSVGTWSRSGRRHRSCSPVSTSSSPRCAPVIPGPAGEPRYPRGSIDVQSSPSSSKAQLGNSPARTSCRPPPTTRGSQSVICPSRRRLVSVSRASSSRTSEHRLGVAPAWTSSSQLGGRSHQSPDQCDASQPLAGFAFHCVSPLLLLLACTKTPVCNSRLTCSMQSSTNNRVVHVPCRSNRGDGTASSAPVSSPHLTRSQRVSCLRRVTHTQRQRDRERYN